MGSVSFVVTFYNKEKYVDSVLDAILAQTDLNDVEYIFVNDGSTDGTAARLSDRSKDFPDAKIITITNSGPAIATNIGFSAATKEYIKPVDGDDILHPMATSMLIAAAEDAMTSVAFGGIDIYGVDAVIARKEPVRFCSLADSRVSIVRKPLYSQISHVLFNPSMVLFRADLLPRMGGCDQRIFIQDVSLGLRLALVSDFVQVHGVVTVAPDSDAMRMSDNQAQILHDINFAYTLLIADHPELPAHIKKYMLRRASGRAWKWASRRGKRSLLSREWICYALAQLRLLPCTTEQFERTCQTFRDRAPIKIPITDKVSHARVCTVEKDVDIDRAQVPLD